MKVPRLSGDAATGPDSGWVRPVATFVVFTALVPVLGAALAWVGFMAANANFVGLSQPALAFAGGMLYATWLGFPVGFAAAAGVGALFVLQQLAGHPANLFTATAIGAVAGIAAIWLDARPSNQLLDSLYLAATVLATLVCWRVTRGRAGRAA